MMQGSPYIYQGQEIGMTNVPFEKIEDYRDVETKNYYKEATCDLKKNESEVMDNIRRISRDNARTPMQWSDERNAGFTSGKPWIDLNPNYTRINVEAAKKDPNSMLNYYKRLMQIRKEYDVMVYGSYKPILEDHQEIYSYIRTFYDENLLVICNFRAGTPTFNLPPDVEIVKKQLLISNMDVDPSQDLNSVELRPYECRVYLFHSR